MVGAGAAVVVVEVLATVDVEVLVAAAVVMVEVEETDGGEPAPQDGSFGNTQALPQHFVPNAQVIGLVNGWLFKQTANWSALVQAMPLSTTDAHTLPHNGSLGNTHLSPQHTVPGPQFCGVVAVPEEQIVIKLGFTQAVSPSALL
jgi:hypothetical protein